MTRLKHLRLPAVIALVTLASLQCSDPPTRTGGVASSIEILDGNNQSGLAGQTLPEPLVVLVTDDNGDPVGNVTVSWSAQGGGSVSAASVATAADGRASVQRTLGSTVGPQTTIAAATGVEGTVTFTSTVGEPIPNGLAITTNPPVSALDREVFDPAAQPVVVLRDGSGNPVEGAEVTASIASGGGTLEGATTATTNASGIASFGDLGIAGTGEQTLEFTSGTASVTSSPVALTALSQQATEGKWGPVVPWDIVPLHMSLLPNGKIFAWGKAEAAATDTMGMPRIWDPATQASPVGLPQIHVDSMLFCAGHTLMPDGRLMVAGGHYKDAAGIKATYFFDQNGTPTQAQPMAHGRWYPTLTVLSDGRVVTMAGRNHAGAVVRTPEIWENNQWVELPGAGNLELPFYPRNFVDPKNGWLFYAGERVQSHWFNPDASGASGRGSWTSGPTHIYGFNREYGSAVMYDAGKVLVVGGGGDPNWSTPDPKATAPTATAETIDLNQTAPVWRSTGSMAFRRRHMNATILPDGQVLATGGTSGGGFVNTDNALAAKAAEIWNPATGNWTTLDANQVMRTYHSVSILLPDGKVLHGASGDAMIGAATPMPREKNHEIFSPPYLFKGARPTITSTTPTVSYGGTIGVVTPNAAQITEARWIRLGSVTHAFDMSQRANTLAFTRTPIGIEIMAPENPNEAPPGHYLLFILNRNGVPSEGKVVRIQ
jgi:hypothetical protein